MFEKEAEEYSENKYKKAKKRIEELEKACNETQELLDKQIEVTLKLDKENADLEWQLQEVVKDNDNYQKENKELEKENAELKTKYESVSIIAHNRGQFALSAMRENREYEIKLTKAKEIIKELLDTQSRLDPYGDIFKDRILKAEQFISEVKK